MENEEMIPVHEFCIHYKVEQSFIHSLNDSGLIEITTTEEKSCVPVSQLSHLEKIIRLHEMGINLEGIETITHLLQKINIMQQEMMTLQNRLRLYENQ